MEISAICAVLRHEGRGVRGISQGSPEKQNKRDKYLNLYVNIDIYIQIEIKTD